MPLIVSSGVGTARDLVQDGKNGWLITPNLENELPKYIDKLVDDPKFKTSVAKQNEALLKIYNIDQDVRALTNVVNYD